MTTLVSVGNAHQPFFRLVEATIAIADQLPQPVIVQHGHTPCPSNRIHAISFMDMDEFEKTVSVASLMIVHAGCGTLIHAFRHGHMPVVMARRRGYNEHLDDHQIEIVQAMASQERIIPADSAKDLPGAVNFAMTINRARKRHVGSSFAVSYIGKIISKYANMAAS